MSDADKVKCACPDCVCRVSPNEATQRDGRPYCGEACASGHSQGSGCGHKGCDCHG